MTTAHDSHPYRLARRTPTSTDTVVEVGSVAFGGGAVGLIAGPCAIESHEALLADAVALRGLGVRMLRGGAYKPRTSPYSFQGLGEAGLEILARVGRETQMAVVTEVLAVADVMRVSRHADMLQVGARNMQNFSLLDAVGRQSRPVLLKRGPAATIDELLCAAEYILAAGNPNVVLCERGVRGFDPVLRNSLDLGAIALLRERTHLPVVVDPSHATGVASLVRPSALGAVAAGADGIMVEASADPAAALVDGEQTIDVRETGRMIAGLEAITAATGRTLSIDHAAAHVTSTVA